MDYFGVIWLAYLKINAVGFYGELRLGLQEVREPERLGVSAPDWDLENQILFLIWRCWFQVEIVVVEAQELGGEGHPACCFPHGKGEEGDLEAPYSSARNEAFRIMEK